MGRPENKTVKDNFIRSDVADREKPVGTCKHCGWRRVFNSTNMQTHLSTCRNYQRFLASDRSLSDLDREVAKAMHDPSSIFNNQPNKPTRKRRISDDDLAVEADFMLQQLANDSDAVTNRKTSRSGSSSQREKTLEFVLGAVWTAFAATGNPQTLPNSSLANIVQTVAPGALHQDSKSAADRLIVLQQSFGDGGTGRIPELNSAKEND